MMERVGTLFTTLAFAATVVGPAMTYADTPNKTPVEIKLHGSEKGFLENNGPIRQKTY